MIKKVILIIKTQPIFFASSIILSFIIGLTQYQFWFGDFSRSDLQTLKEDMALVESETNLIKEQNQDLLKEKLKLSSEKEALEGAARIELGMIKQGEKFYVFKEESSVDSLKEN
jgi:cell division protein FtsB